MSQETDLGEMQAKLRRYEIAAYAGLLSGALGLGLSAIEYGYPLVSGAIVVVAVVVVGYLLLCE